MKNKKIFIFIALIILFQFFHLNLRADDHNKIDEEELPALDPFLGGAVAASAGQSDQTNCYNKTIQLSNLINLWNARSSLQTGNACLTNDLGCAFAS